MSRGKLDCDRILVAVRVRPPHEDDQDNAVKVNAGYSELCIGLKRFTFDNVFDVNESQSAVFERSISNIIEGCVEGFNATILAYGQTGSGKTYTMGTSDTSASSIEIESGIIPRAVELLFSRLNERRNSYNDVDGGLSDVRVQAQFVELYNEELRDLLDLQKLGKSQVKIHESARGEIYLTGVSSRLVTSLGDTLKCLHDGSLARTTASTNMNSTSSRSHAIFSLLIQQRWKMEGGAVERRSAKIHFVDLAGSERMKRTGASGERAREGISINCGLLALGNVISALANAASSTPGTVNVGDVIESVDYAQKEKPKAHIPYRDSKLTRLLADSLGGNARTLMIACISPSNIDKMETLNTLQYASRVKKIRNRVIANRQLQDGQSISYAEAAILRERIRDLENELAAEKLSVNRLSDQSFGRPSDAVGDPRMNQLWSDWEESVADVDAKAAQLKQLTLRYHLRQQVADRNRKLSQLDDSDEVDRSVARMEAELLSLRSRRDVADTQHHSSLQRAFACRDHLLSLLHDKTPRVETERFARESQLQMSGRQADHCHRMCRYLLSHTGSFQRIFCSMMDLLRREHLLLIAHRAITPELTDMYRDLVKQFEGRKKVCWNDDLEEAGTECSSLSSYNAGSDTNERPEVLGGVFDLRSRDLSSWLDQCVQQTVNQGVTEHRQGKKRKKSGIYNKLTEEQTPKITYNLRPRRSGSYASAISSTPHTLTKPLQASSVLNRTFDNCKAVQILNNISSVECDFNVSSIRADETKSEYITPPAVKPSRTLMGTVVTKKRRQPFYDVENNPTPSKVFKSSDDTVKWNNGLPLPVISSPSAKSRFQPRRVETVEPEKSLNTTRTVSDKPRIRNLAPNDFVNSSNVSFSAQPIKSSRRLSFIPRINSQTSMGKRRATLYPNVK